MTIHVKPHLEAVLKAQVDAGNFENMEEALETAILALEDAAGGDEDLAWMKPHLDEAEADFAAGRTLSQDEVKAYFAKRRAER